ncbi:hypothetical protein K438DRAFT_1771047 [Mycena galopus ATCC 62051]|nr:hypothetical protein K438DRAFT_1771047 [Mycena galopus ATCC 62051]
MYYGRNSVYGTGKYGLSTGLTRVAQKPVGVVVVGEQREKICLIAAAHRGGNSRVDELSIKGAVVARQAAYRRVFVLTKAMCGRPLVLTKAIYRWGSLHSGAESADLTEVCRCLSSSADPPRQGLPRPLWSATRQTLPQSTYLVKAGFSTYFAQLRWLENPTDLRPKMSHSHHMSLAELKRHSKKPEEPGEGDYEQSTEANRSSQSSADSAEARVYRPLPMRLGRGSADLAPECSGCAMTKMAYHGVNQGCHDWRGAVHCLAWEQRRVRRCVQTTVSMPSVGHNRELAQKPHQLRAVFLHCAEPQGLF